VRALPTLLLVLVAGCSAPVAGALDDSEANRVMVALDRAGLDATKEPDPVTEGKWKVEVQRDDVPRALAVMRDEELPRVAPSGVLEAVGKGSLVPSEAAEHAQLVAGIAGDLEKSLEGIDGVLSARVHLNVPTPGPLRDLPPPHGSASVLLEHRGSTPPLSADSVQRLVMISRPVPAAPAAGELGHVGPIAVARRSMRELQGALVGLVALVAILAAATLVLYARLTRARVEAARPPVRP